MRKYVKGLDGSRLRFTPSTMERYLWALSVLRYPSSSGQTQCDLITGMPERRNEKRERNRQWGNWHNGQGVDPRGCQHVSPRVFVTYREATGIAHGNWRFTRIFIHVGIGINMGVHGSDVDHWSERVPVMSILHRTYRVTRLRVIYLLNTRQGVWEKITEKVSDETETFRREYRNSPGKTEKLFRGIPLSQNGFGTCLELFGGCQNCCRNFWNFSGEKKPEMFRSCQNRFGCFSLLKIIDPELFRNASKIILVGTGNVLRPTEIFLD